MDRCTGASNQSQMALRPSDALEDAPLCRYGHPLLHQAHPIWDGVYRPSPPRPLPVRPSQRARIGPHLLHPSAHHLRPGDARRSCRAPLVYFESARPRHLRRAIVTARNVDAHSLHHRCGWLGDERFHHHALEPKLRRTRDAPASASSPVDVHGEGTAHHGPLHTQLPGSPG